MTPLTIIILTAILASLTFALCNYRNNRNRAEFRPVEPLKKQSTIPRSHIIAYYRDWLLAIGVIMGMAYGIYWMVNN